MKSRKTPLKERVIYNYYFIDGTKRTLVPGVDGVTEKIVKYLHSKDDAEVYNNNKNWKRHMTEKEKQEWKASHPDEDYPNKWNISADAFFEEGAQDKCDYIADSKSIEEEIIANDEVDYIISQMTEKQQEVCRLLMDGYSQTEIAKKLAISDTSVHKRITKIKTFLKKYFEEGKK